MALIEKYAFRDCCKTTLVDGDTTRNTLQVTGPCYSCKDLQSVTVPAAALIKFGQGGFAQDCFPELSRTDREFLISGICGKCWDEMFAEPESEE
jgi:hypothetical protein